MLRKDQREELTRQADFVREVQGHHDRMLTPEGKTWLINLRVKENLPLAVADHLQDAEALLKEMIDSGVVVSSNPMDHVRATMDWVEKARALLAEG